MSFPTPVRIPRAGVDFFLSPSGRAGWRRYRAQAPRRWRR
jgi:hypothetical protein